MIGRTNAGGSGGGGLNLKVVGGTTKPTSPRENTIWVNTATAITGYILSPTQPETGTEGLVWLKTADTGVEINVGRKNAVLLHLDYARIYTGSAWKDVEGFAFTNGNWAQFSNLRTYLYNAGNQCEALTGGWAITNHTNATCKLLGDCIEISHSRNATAKTVANIHTNSVVNINGYSKLCAQLDITEMTNPNDQYVKFGLGSGRNLADPKYTVNTVTRQPSDGPIILNVDISSATSNYVIFWTAHTIATIRAVWLER